MEDDSFVEVPLAKWMETRDLCLKNWTRSVPHYYALHLNIKLPAVREAFQFKVYCPFGDADNGLVVTTIKGNMDVVIIPMSENTDKLEEAMLISKRIDWSKKICVDLLCPIAVQILRRLEPKLGLSHCKIMPTTTFFYDKRRQPLPEIPIPKNTLRTQATSPRRV